MNSDLLANNPTPVVVAIFVFFVLLELACARFRQPKAQRRDAMLEIFGSGILLAVTFPLILTVTNLLLSRYAPQARDCLAGLPWYAALGLFLVLDDMTQYWWHRLTHHVPFLYALHRAHHSAPYMSIRIVYRNNSFYYLLMPGIWLTSALVYMGLAQFYFGYLIVKMTVIFAAHSSVAWDDRLYRIRALRPLMWLLERTISTPATHSAHHGLNAEDGVTHYKGNFGNLLFLWDVLFGTAKITRRRPPAYGIEDMQPVSWRQEVFWPLVRDPQAQTQTQPQSEHSPEAAR
ncbi:sterol desaturase family protein [Pseudomonas citronellolis]|uniref:sterol desaturase family protein n=1 Tax=Pseudomonas citronellolis TaxID=53408 RepID=UPI0023E4632A|nr:sterol desaturase family protein [Pseudomonas citronellolis]MDF3932173.1 sterol desaturase family protein [Pseudomonas citronellolis]